MSPRPPVPSNEAARLAALGELMVLDSAAEPAFDKLAQLASQLCGVSIGLISLVDEERQWFKAAVGLPGVTETPRDQAFCAHAILDDALFEVRDAADDERFAGNPLVTGDPRIRFYAGAPLKLPSGARIGTLCVMDRAAHQLAPEQAAMLQALAGIATATLTMRRDLILRALSARSQYEVALAASESQHRTMVEEQTELVSLASPDGTLLYVNHAYGRHFSRSPADLVGANFYDFVEPADRTLVRERAAWVLSTGATLAGENRTVAADGSEVWVAWSNSVQVQPDGSPALRSVGRDISARKRAEQALRASQAFLKRTGRVAGVGGWELDLKTGVVAWSEETRRIHEVPDGYRPTLETAIQFYEPKARATVEDAVRRGMETGAAWDLELPLTTHAGRPIWVRAVGEVEFEQGHAVRLLGAFQDITARKQLEHALLRQTATLRSVTEALPAIVSAVDRAYIYRFVNSAFEQWHGLTREQVLGRSALELLATEDVARNRPYAERALAGTTVQFERHYPQRRGKPTLSVTYVPLRLDDGRVDGFVGVALDITPHRQEQVRLQDLAHRDPLTGLLNRAGFHGQLHQALEQGEGPALALLYIDLDHFKPINDSHGHAVGDLVLQAFAHRLVKLVRPSDVIARLGGDEFAVLLRGVRDLGAAQALATKAVDAAQAPFELDGKVLAVGASVGVALGAGPDDADGSGLLARADAQLYRAKQGGRGRQSAEPGAA